MLYLLLPVAKGPKNLTTKRNALNVKLVQANATISNSIEFQAIQI